MTGKSIFTNVSSALCVIFLAAAGCGGSEGTSGTSENSGVSSSSAAGSSGSSTTGGDSVGSAAGTCEAGSSVQGGGSDTCPQLAWRCVDETVDNPPFNLVGAECSAEHTGACCNYSDKCLTNTDGTAGSQSAVEVATGPCQAGCITNPSAQACLDCINASLTSWAYLRSAAAAARVGPVSSAVRSTTV